MEIKRNSDFKDILQEVIWVKLTNGLFKLNSVAGELLERIAVPLGTTVAPKMDVFLENFQTALIPPPRPFLEITLRFFPENPLSMRKFAMKYFGLAMTPPSPPLFGNYIALFFSKIYRFETNKICNVIFWIGNDPPMVWVGWEHVSS